VLEATPEELDLVLDQVEAELVQLSEGLARPVPNDTFHVALLLLGQRARSLFRGFTILAGSDTPTAAMALLRPTTEINLILRFIVAKPQLHSEIWVAEGERQSLLLIREFAADGELKAKLGEEVDLDAEWITERHEYVEEVRAKARAAGVAGVSKSASKPVLPGMRTIARNHGDLATREAYTFAYRALSQDIHTGPRAFSAGEFIAHDDGTASFRELADPPHEVRRHRQLNASTFASTLSILSGPLQLDVFGPASALRDALVSAKLVSDPHEWANERSDG
jgi:hypothetical protein